MSSLPDAFRVDVAGDDGEPAPDPALGVVDHAQQTRVREEEREARQGRRVGLLLQDRRDEVAERTGDLRDRRAGGGERADVRDDREPPVELAGDEGRAERGARHAHEAPDLHALRLERAAERSEVVACLLEAPAHRRVLRLDPAQVPGELDLGRVERIALGDVRAAEEFADETAARVGQEIELRAVGQGGRERKGIRDHALGEAPVLEREDVVAIARAQPGERARARLGPQITEAAPGARCRAVDEHEHRRAGGHRAGGCERERAGHRAHPVETGSRPFRIPGLAGLEPRRDRAHRLLHRIDAKELQSLEHEPAEAALGGRTFHRPRRRHLEHAVGGRGAPAALRVGGSAGAVFVAAEPQPEPVLELELDQVVAADRLDRFQLRARSGRRRPQLGPHAHARGLQQRCGRMRRLVAAQFEAVFRHRDSPSRAGAAGPGRAAAGQLKISLFLFSGLPSSCGCWSNPATSSMLRTRLCRSSQVIR